MRQFVSHPRFKPGTRRVSQVPDASLHACHALRWTPADPRGPHRESVRLCWLPMPLKTLPSALNAMTGLYQALESTVSPAACMFPCVRFNRLVRPFASSVAVATLGRSGWLILTPQGLSPCQKRQALLGALTAQRSAASRASILLPIGNADARGLAAATFCWAASGRPLSC